MKKNWFIRSALLVLILIVGTCSMLGTTFARYTSTATIEDAARVAKFAYSVKGRGTDFGATAQEIDIFATVTGGSAQPGYVAPGSTGNFPVAVVNSSEVAISVTFTATVVASAGTVIPLQFSIDNSNWTTLAAVMTSLTTNYTFMAKAASVTKTVYWRWNPTDTAVGFATAATDSTNRTRVTITAVVNQVD